VFEDTSLFADCIANSLAKQGERNVTVLEGVESLKPFVGILRGGERIPINLHKVKAAFVDGSLEGKLHGPDIVPALHDKNIFTVAMSTEKKVNDSMVSLGADLGAQKPVVIQMVYTDKLRVPEAIDDPVKSQADLDYLRTHFKDPEQVKDRKKMESEMMTKFNQEEAAAAAKKEVAAKAEVARTLKPATVDSPL
jgi:hypothetical protein